MIIGDKEILFQKKSEFQAIVTKNDTILFQVDAHVINFILDFLNQFFF